MFCNVYLDKRTDITKITLSKVEKVFGDILLKDIFCQSNYLKKLFFSQNDENIKTSINKYLFKLRKKGKKLEPSDLPEFGFSGK